MDNFKDSDVASLMNGGRRIIKNNPMQPDGFDPGPLWSAKQFAESLNSAIRADNAVRKRNIAPVTLDQCADFLKNSGRNNFNDDQYAVFQRWTRVRIGFSSAGVHIQSPEPTLTMPTVDHPVFVPGSVEALPEDTSLHDLGAGKTFERAAGKGVSVN